MITKFIYPSCCMGIPGTKKFTGLIRAIVLSMVFLIFQPGFRLQAQFKLPAIPSNEQLSNQFEYNTEYIYRVSQGSEFLEDGAIIAYVNGQIRGAQTASVLFPPTGNVVYVIRVFSNTAEGDSITFRYYDVFGGKIYEIEEKEYFVSDNVPDYYNPDILTAFCAPPGKATGLLPADQANDQNSTLDLFWQPAQNTLYYNLYLWKDGDPVPSSPYRTNIYGTSARVYNLQYGTLYHWYVVSVNQCQQEASISQAFSIRDLPDLAAGNIVAVDSIMALASFPVSFTVTNQGAGSTTSTLWYDGVYLSTDNLLSGDDYFLGHSQRVVSLGTGETYDQNVNVSIPTNYFGNYYLIAKTDRTGSIPEANEQNNTIATSRPVYVKRKPLADISISGISAEKINIMPRDTLDFSWEIDNLGEDDATGGWTEKVSIVSLSGIRVNLVGTPSFTGILAKGSSVTRSYSFVIPEILSFDGEANIEVELVPSVQLLEYPEDKANNKAISANRVNLLKSLYLVIPESLKEDYTGEVRCYVSRSGNYYADLQVNLSATMQGQLNLPATLTIPAKSSSLAFNISPVNNTILDGTRNVSLTATAQGYSPVSKAIRVLDDEVPSLSLVFDKTTAVEGDTINLTISRDLISPDSVVVLLSTSQTGQWTFPSSAVIPKNSASVSVKVVVTENTTPEINMNATLSARATGVSTGNATITIQDDDIPTIEMEILADTVSEEAGPYATWAVIRKVDNLTSTVRVNLSASIPNALFFPTSILLESNVRQKQVNIGVVDNALVDGFRNVELTAAVYISSCNCNTTADNGGIVKRNLTIIDNDGPSLTLSVDPPSLAEGRANAGTLTVFRNTPATSSLLVNLSSSDAGELTLPSTVTIPAGQSSTKVTLTTINDQLDDGSQMVTIQANAAGFSPGIVWVNVTDINRPDLQISDLETGNDTAIANNHIEVQVSVRNIGFGKAPSNVKVGIYLSKNDKKDDSDTLIFTGTIAEPIDIDGTAQFIDLVKLPAYTGKYYLFAEVNPEGDISELLYINNISFAAPLEMLPAYGGMAQADPKVLSQPSPVNISGKAVRPDGTAVPNAKLDVYVISDGVRRVIKVTTDDKGNYLTKFEPFSYESGHYTVGACYPGQDSKAVQDAFDILGMERASRDYVKWNIKKTVPYPGKLAIRNKSNIPLTNVKLELKTIPEGLTITVDSIQNLPGMGSAEFNYSLLGMVTTPGKNWVEIPVKISSAEGISFEFTAYYFCQALGSHLQSSPASINTTISKGKVRYLDLKITNNGAGETGPVKLELPNVEWMSLATPDTLSLQPGDTSTITLMFNPAPDIPLNTPFSGRIVVHNTNGDDLPVPYTVEVVSEEKGSFKVDVVDEYTYFTDEEPHVQNAHVVIRHPYTGKIVAEGFTDPNGIFLAKDLPEGNYKLLVEADKHEGYQNIITVDPGRTNEETVFLSFQAITYTWEVVPTEIEDRYEVELIMEFETNVPAPVVIMEMPKDMPMLQNDETYTFMVTLTNKGLIRAEDVELSFPTGDPEYEWVTNFTKTDLMAQQAIQVPVTMQRKDSKKAYAPEVVPDLISSGGNCSDYAVTVYGFECGPDRQWRQTSALFTISGRVCSGSGSLPSGWGGWGGYGPGSPGGGGYSGYGTYSSSPSASTSTTGCDPCLISVLTTILGCAGGGVGTALACIYSFTDGDISLLDAIGCIPGPVGCGASVISTFLTCYQTPPWGAKKSFKLYGIQAPNLEDLVSKGAPPIMLQAIRDLERAVANNQAERDYVSEYFGSLAWDTKESFIDFVSAIDTIVTPKQAFNENDRKRVKEVMQGTDITATEVDNFINRWNQTMDAWGKGILSPNTTYPNIIDQLKLDEYKAIMASAMSYATGRGYSSVSEMQAIAWQTLKEEAEGGRSSVCASVTIKISQQLVMTREAFEGTLTIFNGNTTTAMNEIKLDLEIRNEQGELCNDLFQIETKGVDILTGIDGTGTLGANQKGSATILFIPEKGAAPEVPVSYSFGGSFSYIDPFTDTRVSKPLFPVTLAVNPSPDLFLHYFMQRDILGDDALTEPIEPIVPAELAVMIVNNGYGTAKSVRIESAQPEIIDNEKGLAIHFALIGSNLNGQPRQLGLTNIDFGNIPPKSSTIGQWWFTSDLLGHFVNYSASVTHLDSRGNPDLSLVSGAELHELIRSIRVYGGANDGINDFLVNEVQDSKEQPDAIYLSQGDVVFDVYGAGAGVFDGQIQAPSFRNTVKVISSRMGWNYIKLPDPGNGRYQIVSVTRNSDQQLLPIENTWLTHVTLPDGREPVYENMFHLVDNFENGGEQEYTITWKVKDPDPPRIVNITGAPATYVTEPLGSLIISFNKEINESTFTYEDMTLRLQGGKDIMDTTVVITKITPLTYSVNLSSLTTGNGFYVLNVQAAEIEDLLGTKGLYGKQVSWTQFLSVPAVEEFIGLPEDKPGPPFDFIMVRFNLPIDANTLLPSRFIVSRDGVQVGNPLSITMMDTDAKLFKLNGLGNLMDKDGNYTLTVDLPNIATIDGEKGILQQAVEWIIDTTPPAIMSIQKLFDGGFDNQHITGFDIVFSEDVAGFGPAAFELWKDGLRQPLSQVHIDSIGNQTYRLSQFRLITYYPGSYILKVNAGTINDLAGISGSGIMELTWIVDRTKPRAAESLRISPDLGYSDSDGVTSVKEMNVIMSIPEPVARVEVYRNDFGVLTFLAGSENVQAGELTLPVLLSSAGKATLEVQTFNDLNNFNAAHLDVFIDEKAHSGIWTGVPSTPVESQPLSLNFAFSEKIIETSLDKKDFYLWINDNLVDASGLTVSKLSDTLYSIGGLSSFNKLPGNYTIGFDLMKTHKYSSGFAGTYVAKATWTLLDVNSAPVASAGVDFAIVPGEVYWLDGSGSSDPDDDQLSFEWFPPEGISLDDNYIPSPSFTAPPDTGATSFTFLLLVSDGFLTSTDKVNVFIKGVSVPGDSPLNNSFLLYPNPCDEFFTLRVDRDDILYFRMVNLAGEVVMNRKWTGEKQYSFYAGDLPEGLYIVQLKTKEGVMMKKLVVL